MDIVYYTEKNNGGTKSHNNESKKSDRGIKKDDNTTTQNNKDKVPKTITKINTQIEDDWITVKNTNTKKKVVKESIQKADRQNGKNQYKDLQTDEDEMEVEDFGIEEIGKERVEVKKKKSYDINEITVKEMVRYINVYEGEVNNLRDGNSKDVPVNTIGEGSELEMEDEISYDEAEDSDDSIDLSEEESSSSVIIEEENENEGIKMTKEEDKGKQLESKENEEEESLYRNEERDHKMKQLLYQNDLLLFRIEQAEMKEEKLWKELNLQTNAKRNETNQEVIRLQKQLKDKEEEWRCKVKEYDHKIETVEKVLAIKMKQLIDQLRRRSKC